MFVELSVSGSGKVPFLSCYSDFTTESGRILIDGFDIKSADLASLRQQIGVVLQDDFLLMALSWQISP